MFAWSAARTGASAPGVFARTKEKGDGGTVMDSLENLDMATLWCGMRQRPVKQVFKTTPSPLMLALLLLGLAWLAAPASGGPPPSLHLAAHSGVAATLASLNFAPITPEFNFDQCASRPILGKS
jgi:hypothetical protein